MCTIHIGRPDSEFLAIALFDRSHPACQDYWDGNWIRSQVEVVAGGFHGRAYGDLRADELVRFYDRLSNLEKILRGTAEFATMEGWLSIRVVGDGKGHMTFECELQDEPGVGNTLKFQLRLDQTFLPLLLSQLREAIAHFPVLGQAS
ncbi:hypothetical protein KIH39_19170 [Telmatocola sphagniphila]|uniref:Uncharacterized protein n=1 Tax=Telmatocola sphagniphila TaxID=1123043 RepID=A0A8E6EX74_9BACT|nr:hypothetical protein [Telmatocola sphagniphila]QVL30956.1 hypothetical protein KIH39_19170 [Telmatocola sphagniphila]